MAAVGCLRACRAFDGVALFHFALGCVLPAADSGAQTLSQGPALVTVGWDEIAPCLQESEDGLSGFDVILLEEIRDRAGLRLAWRPLEGERILQSLARG